MYLRKYEVFFIVDPDLSDEDTKGLEEKLKDVVVREGGKVLTYSSWGKRKLAYPVKKRTRGHYFLMEIAGGPDLPLELERNMRIDDRVLKFITVKLEDRYEPDKEEKEEAPDEKAKSEDVEMSDSESQEQAESETEEKSQQEEGGE